MSVLPSNAVNALPPTQNLQGLAQDALGTLGGLPNAEEAVDGDESEAGGLQYDKGEEAALGSFPDAPVLDEPVYVFTSPTALRCLYSSPGSAPDAILYKPEGARYHLAPHIPRWNWTLRDSIGT